MSYITTNSVYKIIQAVSSFENNFTIDLKTLYRGIINEKPIVKVYCMPKKIEVLDSDIGYELEVEDLGNYVYSISQTTLGLKSAPNVLFQQEYVASKEANVNKSFKIDKYYKRIFVTINGAHEFKGRNVKLIIDDTIVEDLNFRCGINENYSKHVILQIENPYIEHTFKIQSFHDFDYFSYVHFTVIAEGYRKFSNLDNEINCFFILKNNG